MHVAFNIDCGEVLPGHQLVARGLRDDGLSDDSLNGDYMGHHDGKPVHRVVSLVYALLPGLPHPDEGVDSLDVDASIVLDPPPDPAIWGPALDMGAERDARPGGNETTGAFGPFIFPEGTLRVLVEFSQIKIVPAGEPQARPGTATRRRLGTLEIEVASGSAAWTPE